MLYGCFIGDALAMPVHWYYDREALHREYGEVTDYLPPRHPHSGSILWRSSYNAPNLKGEILHDQARFWGQRDIHYHQNLRAGENTLNLKLALLLSRLLPEVDEYDPARYLEAYVEFMTTSGRHRDTYVEECHRHFFTQYANGKAPEKCGGEDIHIGGLSHVPVLCAWFGADPDLARKIVRKHVSLTHTSPLTLEAADTLTQILCSLLAGSRMSDALSEYAANWLPPKKSLKWLREADSAVVGGRFSTACYLKDAFPAALYLALKYSENPENGLIANTNLGGDNCHRGTVLGALLGAFTGLQAFPDRWRDGLLAREELDAFISASSRGT
jgi:ADP-ribosyl-[dinitrogen reductase] hydrolase